MTIGKHENGKLRPNICGAQVCRVYFPAACAAFASEPDNPLVSRATFPPSGHLRRLLRLIDCARNFHRASFTKHYVCTSNYVPRKKPGGRRRRVLSSYFSEDNWNGKFREKASFLFLFLFFLFFVQLCFHT